jgi:hypothetical protein
MFRFERSHLDSPLRLLFCKLFSNVVGHLLSLFSTIRVGLCYGTLKIKYIKFSSDRKLKPLLGIETSQIELMNNINYGVNK